MMSMWGCIKSRNQLEVWLIVFNLKMFSVKNLDILLILTVFTCLTVEMLLHASQMIQKEHVSTSFLYENPDF